MSVSVAYPADPSESSDSGDLALRWLDSERSAKLLLDASFSVRWANAKARSWIESAEVFSVREGKLWIADSQTELRHLIGRVSGSGKRTCIPVARRSPAVVLILSASRLAGTDQDPVYGVSGRFSNDLDFNELASRFELTVSERRILELLIAQGMTAQQSAAELRLSVETVRTHIRRLYEKVGVNSREALFVRLRPYFFAL